jgi:hypothetical protein
MALAMIYPDPEKGGRGNKKERVAESAALFSATRLKQARSVLRHSAKLAEAGRRWRGPSKPIFRNSQPARGLFQMRQAVVFVTRRVALHANNCDERCCCPLPEYLPEGISLFQIQTRFVFSQTALTVRASVASRGIDKRGGFRPFSAKCAAHARQPSVARSLCWL